MNKSVFYRWWFYCIGIGFLLLGTRSALVGDVVGNTVLRFVIGVGFLILGTIWFPRRT